MQKNKNKNQDRSTTVLVFTIATTLILAAISFIPPRNVGKGEIKRANLLSDIVEFEDAIVITKTSKDILDTSFLADLRNLDAMNEKIDSLATASQKEAEKELDKQHSAKNETATETEIAQKEDTTAKEPKRPIPLPLPAMADIEDFSKDGKMMADFYETLEKESQERTVRIAFLGDSFIESDIITSDLRQMLQEIYGGDGVGFIPFADPLAKYRPTMEQTYENWESHSVMRKKKAPQHLLNDFYVSGLLGVPLEGATTHFTSKSYKNRTAKATRAKLLFKSRGKSRLELIVNKTDTMQYEITPDDKVQHLDVRARDGGKINSLSVTLNESNDFVGYGAVFEETKGVSVHNYGLRSNSGLALFSTDRAVNRQIDDMMNYDLVVLEYGLNVMQKDVTDYTYYGNQLRRLISYIKDCFPNAAILVMSVGDVGVRENGEVSTSPAVGPMIAEQRAAAYDQEVAFWNLFNVMGGENSMQNFVAQGWAAKDYTHINHRGGRVIADKLAQTFSKAIEVMNVPVLVEMQPLETMSEQHVTIGDGSEIDVEATKIPQQTTSNTASPNN